VVSAGCGISHLGRCLGTANEGLQVRRTRNVSRQGSNIIARSLLALQAIPHRTGADQPEALAQDATTGHVLLRLQLTEIQGRGKDKDISHVDQTLQEGHGHLQRHALRGLQDIQFGL